MKSNRVALISLGLIAAVLPLQAQKAVSGIKTLAPPPQDCITPAERKRISEVITAHQRKIAGRFSPTLLGPEPYPFVPQAGNLWDEIFVTNFVDLDPTTGIRDWDNTNWTYDGHRGHDISLRSFAEQDAGVPIFAALDGQVVDSHDGEFDRRTGFVNGAAANYVILWHGGTHYTYYWHMRAGSVAVGTGAQVKRGTQLGLTGSSGYSTGPHLHFESWFNNNYFEPSTGVGNPGPSSWVNQPQIPRFLYCEQINVTNVDIGAYPGLPADIPRSGTFRLHPNTYQGVKFWAIFHNIPVNSPYRLRYLRPDGSVNYDTGILSFGNSGAYRWAWFWWWYNLKLDVIGEWKIEVAVDGQVVAVAPLRVIGASDSITNRPPENVTARFDPANPTTSDAIFCRLTVPLISDKDYDFVKYRYVWKVNGAVVRDVTIAGHADAMPKGAAGDGDTVTCSVTPTDGTAFASTQTLSTSVLGTARVGVSGHITFSTPTQGSVPVTFEFRPPTLGPAILETAAINPATGTYAFTDIPNKSYLLHVKGAKWLAKNITVNAVAGSVLNVNLTLTAGDADNNNVINVDDLSRLLSVYNSAAGDGIYLPGCDFNGDNRVDVDDLTVLLNNYNVQGDL